MLRIVIWRETPRPGSGKNGKDGRNGTVDGSEIPNHRLDVKKLVNNGMNYQPQLVSRISSINSRKG